MEFTQAQDHVVRALVASAPIGEWQRLVADIEILEHPEGYQIDAICLAVMPDGDDLGLFQFDLSTEASEAVAGLFRQRQDAAGTVMGSFELTIDPPGRFRFAYAEEPPKRLNGNWDAARASHLTHYLDVYHAEQARTERT